MNDSSSIGLLIAIYAIAIILLIASMWKIFTKAGKPGWASIIPIYNVIVLLEIVGKPMWWLAIILLVPGVNLIFSIWMVNLLSKSFGKNEGYTIGLILLPFIFYPILGFGNAQYQPLSAQQ